MRDLENLEVPKLDSFQRNDLDRPVIDDEIEWAVFQLPTRTSEIFWSKWDTNIFLLGAMEYSKTRHF